MVGYCLKVFFLKDADSYALTGIRHPAAIVNWMKEELEAADMKTWKLLTMHEIHTMHNTIPRPAPWGCMCTKQKYPSPLVLTVSASPQLIAKVPLNYCSWSKCCTEIKTQGIKTQIVKNNLNNLKMILKRFLNKVWNIGTKMVLQIKIKIGIKKVFKIR